MTASAPNRVWLPALLTNAVIWGSSFLFIKIGVSELHPTWVGAGRILIGAAALLVILKITGDRLPRERWVWGHMVLPGVIGVALPFTLFAYGEELIPSLLAGIWNATTALWVLPFAVLVFRVERFTARTAGGLVLGFAGVLMVLGFWNATGGSLSGQLMCAAAAACYGVAIPYLRRFVTGRTTASGVSLAATQTIIAAVVATAGALVVEGLPPSPASLSGEVIAAMVALGVFGSGVAFALHMRVISAAGASTAAFVTYLVPLVATVLGVVALDERLTWNQPVGAVIVLLGVAVAQGAFSRMYRRRRGAPESSPVTVPVAMR